MRTPAALLLVPLLCAARPAEVRVDFNATKVTATHTRGYADRATKRRATADDPVRIASVSKLVTALGVMRLVEAGTLDLDRDVSAYLGWQLRHPEFPDTLVTLRLLLSHRSGLRDDGDNYAIPLGQTVRVSVEDPKAWEPGRAPGTWFRYTNLNFPVVASVMERATGERFDRLMQRLVFAPLALDACFNWTTCSDAKLARAVVLYDSAGAVVRDDLKGVRPDCPVNATDGCAALPAYRPGDNGALFSPQGGVRASMHDLARIGRVFLNDGDGFLQWSSIETLINAMWTFDGTNGDTENGFYCRYSLAWQSVGNDLPGCRDKLFTRGTWAGHAGSAYRVRSGLWIDYNRKRGVAFFATAVPDGEAGRHSAYSATEERLAKGR